MVTSEQKPAYRNLGKEMAQGAVKNSEAGGLRGGLLWGTLSSRRENGVRARL